MPTWQSVVDSWQQKNSARLNAYTAAYQKNRDAGVAASELTSKTNADLQAAGTPEADTYAFSDPDVVNLQSGRNSGQPSSAKGQQALAATAVSNAKAAAPSPSGPLSVAPAPPQNQQQASQALGAAMSGNPNDSYAMAKKKGTLRVTASNIGGSSYMAPR